MVNLQLHSNVLIGYRTWKIVHVFNLFNSALITSMAQYILLWGDMNHPKQKIIAVNNAKWFVYTSCV